MSIFDNISKKVTDTAKAAAKKSGDIVEVTKLNMSIGTEEDKIKKAYYEIGKAVYENFSKGEEIAEPLKELCEKVQSYEKCIEEMRLKILELKSLRTCSGCGAELEIGVAFCPKCGTKQEDSSEDADQNQ